MFIKTVGVVAVTIFLAEIGDKTQLATFLFATDAKASKWAVFWGAALALVAAAGLGVLVGDQVGRLVSPKTLKVAAGIGFIAVGLWTLWRG